MISKQAIQAFLARKLNNYSWAKRCSPAALRQAVYSLTPKPDFGSIQPWAHQLVSFLLLQELKRFQLHIDMGGGKTAITLMLLKYRKQCGERPRAIVFVPYITSVETWVEEVAKHAPDLTCVPLLGGTVDNLSSLQLPGDLFVVCYQSAVAMVTFSVAGGNGRTKWQLTSSQVREHFASFDTLVLDEIHRCKNCTSLTYRMCRAISAQCEYVLGLTGTPFGRDLSDLWPQYNLIDFGATLGPTKGFFMEVFYTQKPGYWTKYTFKFKQRLLPDLKRMMKNCSISYSIDEFADMLPKQYFIKQLPCPPDVKGYCQLAIAAINREVKGKKTFQVIESNYQQLCQLSSGFLTLKDEAKAKLQVRFASNPKLDLMMELIEAMPHGCKAVIFHHFIYSSFVISERLKEAKIKHARIWGGQKDPIGELRRFKQDPNCAILVLNWRSGSASLNLQNANYVYVYEQPDSPIDRKQGEARVWRPGQAKRVMIYDLLVQGTYDRRTYEANRASRRVLDDVMGRKS